MVAVAYARYSSAGQRDVSIEQQLADIRSYAARENIQIIHEYADHARSGYKHLENRDAFRQMISAAESGTFDTVLVWKVDRFGRNREDSAVYKGRLRRHGVKVIYVMEPIPDGSAGILLEGMLEATAEWYSVNLSENVRRGLNDNAARCLYNGSRIYGYTVGSVRRYQIMPERAAVVRRIYALCLEGRSLSEIAAALNDAGLRNPYGKLWSHTFIYRILHHESYCGTYIWKNLRVPDGVPAIIDRKTWEAAQAMLKRSIRAKASSSNVDYLLTGKAFCGLCRSPMVGDSGTSKTGAVHHYYACQGHKRRTGCKKKSVPKQLLEDAVIDFIFDHCLAGEEMEKIASAVIRAQEESMKTSPLPQMERELSEIERKISNINKAIAEGIWNSSTKDMLDELTAARESLLDSIASLRASSARLMDHDSVIAHLRRLAAQDRNDPECRRFVVNTFINAVYVYDDRFYIALNAIDGVSPTAVPLDLPGSDIVSDAPLYGIHPNPAVIMYSVPIKRGC